MSKNIDVLTGMVVIGDDRAVLTVRAIGSCVVVLAYCRMKKMAGLAHIMLPGAAPDRSFSEKTKYATNALEEMFSRMSAFGIDMKNTEICMIGGANVLNDPDNAVGKNNIDSINEFLEKRGMCVRARTVGGIERRSVSFDVARGIIFYTIGDSDRKLLWPAY